MDIVSFLKEHFSFYFPHHDVFVIRQERNGNDVIYMFTLVMPIGIHSPNITLGNNLFGMSFDPGKSVRDLIAWHEANDFNRIGGYLEDINIFAKDTRLT